MALERLVQTEAIDDNEQAFGKLKVILKEQGYTILHERPENKKRDLFLTIAKNAKRENIYCKYRREQFYTYSFQFPTEKGNGESINQEILRRTFALKTDRIIFAYQNGEVKYCYPLQIKNYAEANNTIRRQKGKEITYSFPIDLLNNLQDKQ